MAIKARYLRQHFLYDYELFGGKMLLQSSIYRRRNAPNNYRQKPRKGKYKPPVVGWAINTYWLLFKPSVCTFFPKKYNNPSQTHGALVSPYPYSPAINIPPCQEESTGCPGKGSWPQYRHGKSIIHARGELPRKCRPKRLSKGQKNLMPNKPTQWVGFISPSMLEWCPWQELFPYTKVWAIDCKPLLLWQNQ